jgi:DUF4097 and DUF4098 domain-containing protein YvlB
MMRYAENADGPSGDERQTQTATFDPEGIDGLEVSTEEVEVEIRTHDRNKVDIVLETYENGPALETRQTEDTLEITATESESHYFFKNSPATRLTVVVPDHLWDSLSIDTESGGISLTGMKVSRLGIKTFSGELEIENMQVGESSLKTSSGGIVIRKVEAESFSFVSASGRVSLTDVNGKIYGKTQSGPITVHQLEGAELDLKSRAGSIEIHGAKADNASFQTTSGEIDVEKLAALDTQFYSRGGDVSLKDLSGEVRGSTISGEVELEVTDVGRDIRVETSSGDIVLRRNQQTWNAQLKLYTGIGEVNVAADARQTSIQEKNRFEGIIGSGDGNIHLQSQSGDIELL